MRRLLLPFLLVAAAAIPAAAEDRDGFLCAGAAVSGNRVPTADTGVTCLLEDYRYRVVCHDDYVAVEPDVAVQTWVCIPGG